MSLSKPGSPRVYDPLSPLIGDGNEAAQEHKYADADDRIESAATLIAAGSAQHAAIMRLIREQISANLSDITRAHIQEATSKADAETASLRLQLQRANLQLARQAAELRQRVAADVSHGLAAPSSSTITVGKSLYPNVVQCAQNLRKCYAAGRKILSLFGEMQAGKTDAMCIAARDFAAANRRSGESVAQSLLRQVFFIAGYSDSGLKKDSKEKIQAWFAIHFPGDNVQLRHLNYEHRNNITKAELCNRVKRVSKGLIILDEVHLASDKNSSVHKFFKNCDNLMTEDLKVRILAVSATPTTLKDLALYGNLHDIVSLDSGVGYVGVKALFEARRVREAKNLSKDPEAAKEMVQQILHGDATEGGQGGWGKFLHPKMHILRPNFTAPKPEQVNRAQRERKELQTECRALEFLEDALAGAGFKQGEYRICFYDSQPKLTPPGYTWIDHDKFIAMTGDVEDGAVSDPSSCPHVRLHQGVPPLRCHLTQGPSGHPVRV